ncbi:hypothetical protein A1O3_03987 [Capronia epimyces CBS 606.96]|uniref:Zn(2)-C6 fungal-type domain-containing protein n=1 Tax=Capronia epimyces CBS 606.96 TaxID=1182542 RepID=W9YBJ7_9EURO|nr:uncharacterized protein A1O3_03987 [Capronia epimyces CBS 606.96]EXJ87030.1 hypothetical protein A1O3_03987 [Capronia epimyces CBS 606.96]
MATAAEPGRRLRTACDRCYRLKERCTRLSIAHSCARCDRLDLSCATVRPQRPAGRRPHRSPGDHRRDSGRSSSQAGTNEAADVSPNPPPLDIGAWLRGVPHLRREEREKLLFFLGRPENLDCCVVSPNFRDAEQRSLAAPLATALPVLKDAYLACAGALKLIQPPHPPVHAAELEVEVEVSDEDVNLRHALAAMTTLRALPVATPQDAALCLTLGVSLALFVYSAIGQGVYEISRHCLSVAKPFVEMDTLDSDAEQWLTFLVLFEMTDCLVHRRRPTIRLPAQGRLSGGSAVDRHLGLCAPLLSFYHDLCVVSHSLANTTDASYMALIEEQLGRIQADVQAWQPSQPDRFVERFDTAEVVHLLAQARLYRLAALLVGHRLRCAFGEQDGQADIWATEIMTELELARRITGRSTRCVTLPFVAAAIEMRDPAARVKALRDTDEYVDQFTPVVQRATKTFLSRVWRDRDRKLTASWFDSTCKPCVVLASIDKALFG